MYEGRLQPAGLRPCYGVSYEKSDRKRESGRRRGGGRCRLCRSVLTLGSVPNGVEASENSVSASEVSRETLRVHSGEVSPPNVSSSRPRLLRDIVSEILLAGESLGEL